MEEIQSTEILDREILEDARKKASRILKNAEDTIKAKAADWEKKLNITLSELQKKYAQQTQNVTDEIMTHLPIDKRRIKVKKIEEMLHSAVKTWYTGLPRSQVLDLLTRELKKCLGECSKFSPDSRVNVRTYLLEQKEAESLTQAVLPAHCGIASCTIEKIHPVSEYPGIILETSEVKISASIEKIVEYILSEQRAELAEALLGSAALPGISEFAGGKL